MAKDEQFEEEEMTVDLELEDGRNITCSVIKILTVDGQDYIVLLPVDDAGEPLEDEVWFYRYRAVEGEEPELGYIDDDEEYDAVADAFDEYLDNCEFDEMDE